MEHYPHNQGEQPQRRLPSEEAHEAGEAGERPAPDVEFGHLDRIPPTGASWAEFVITRGIAAAEREDRSVDDRTAHYIAASISRATTPALRTLAMTGAVHKTNLEEEAVSILFDQTSQVQTWIGWLANYCQNREDFGPVENWRPAIEDQDRTEAELLRREQLLAELDDLFERPTIDELAGVEELGWLGLVHHDGRAGGWILHHQAQDDSRDVFETDSDTELTEYWRSIAADYMDMYWRARPERPEGDK